MKMDTYRVPMRPHGLIFGGIEAYHPQDAFGSVPGPPGPQKRAKNGKKGSKTSKTSFFPCFSPHWYPFKGGVWLVVLWGEG